MPERDTWAQMRGRRMAEPGAAEAYEAARMAFELGAAVRELRMARGWSQAELASAAGMTQSAVARFEAGGTIPTLPVVGRIARALDADLTVRVAPRAGARDCSMKETSVVGVAHSALAALTADERAVVLAELLRVHPGFTAETEQLARGLLELSDRDGVAREVAETLLALNLGDLATRAGPQWGGGYVEPHEAADELLADAVQPYLDDLKRRARAGARHAATEIGLGVLLGLYACRDVDDNDLLLTHAGTPDAVDDLAWQVRSAMTASGLEMPEGWLAEECPDWRP